MPGPCSQKPYTRRPDNEKPNRKTARRLKARIEGFSKSNDKYAEGFHIAGSQNRNK